MEKFFQWLIKGRGAYVLAVCLGLISISSLAYGLTLNKVKNTPTFANHIPVAGSDSMFEALLIDAPAQGKVEKIGPTFSVDISASELASMSGSTSSYYPLEQKQYVSAISNAPPAKIVKCVYTCDKKNLRKIKWEADSKAVIGSPEYEKNLQKSIDAAWARIPFVRAEWGKIIDEESERFRVDPDLTSLGISLESGGDPDNHSEKGALGLMQLMTDVGAELLKHRGVRWKNGKELYALIMDPRMNISLGVQLLKENMDFYHDPVKALVAYSGNYSYQIKRFGSDVEVDYYRIAYRLYVMMKDSQWEPLDPAMRPARPPETGTNLASMDQ